MQLQTHGTLTELFLELCEMGMHDDETKATYKYYLL